MYLSGLMGRMKYFTAWCLAGAVCNASGLGFSGVDERGRQRWDAVSNVHLWQVEVRRDGGEGGGTGEGDMASSVEKAGLRLDRQYLCYL